MNVKEFVEYTRKSLIEAENINEYKDVYNYIVKKAIRYDEFKDLSLEQINAIVIRTIDSIKSDVSVLKKYIEDDTISEIMVNGFNNIFIEQDGKIIETGESFFDTEELEEVIRRISGKVHREVNELNPIVDARLEDGSRVNAVYKNIALGGPALTIRKFPQKNISMDTLIKWQSITKEAVDFLKRLMDAEYNFFISGGTSSGKTTFLNAMARLISSDERVIVIEDSAELQINNLPNLVRMECKKANTSGAGEISMDKLIKTSLRMRPDRILIGEIRDGKALLNMLNGLNTGHSGICTGHGNSVTGMIKRMEALYMQESNFPIETIDSQIAEGIDIIIHLSRRKDFSRKVMEISELYINENGRIETNKLFEYKDGQLQNTGNQLIHREKEEIKYE